MMRSEIKGAILLVDYESEGRFYNSLAHQDARVIPSHSIALDILNSATQRGVSGLTAAVRKITAANELTIAQFAPSIGDTSSLLICSSNFERAIINATGRIWYNMTTTEIGSLALHCTALAYTLEKISEKTSIPLEKEALLNLICWKRFSLLEDPIVNIIGATCFSEIKSEFANACKKTLRELLPYCEGDLVINIIAGAIKSYQPHGLKSESTVSFVELSRMLELSYPLENIEDDPIFWKMRKWERRNPRYNLLQQWRTLDPFKLVWDQRYWECDLKALLSLGEAGGGLSLIKLDLDNFKSVNTSLGHSGGDEAIKIASQTIISITQGMGEVYRRGGDEFIIIAPDLRGEEASLLGENIRIEIEKVFASWGTEKKLEIYPTASIGIVDADYAICFDKLTQAADNAQQSSKDRGKNICTYITLKTKES